MVLTYVPNMLLKHAAQINALAAIAVRHYSRRMMSLLQYATADNPNKEAAAVSPEEVLREVRSTLAEEITRQAAEISWRPLAVVRAHRGRIFRLFRNLVSNAITYPNRVSAPSFASPQVLLTDRLDVEDNGIGIPDEYRDKIFTP